MNGKRVALLVGCSEYEDPEFSQLRAPVQDVEALQSVLADPAIGAFQLASLLNEQSGTVVEQIERFFANRKPDDLLLLYFSCHGVLDSRGRLYFVTANTRKGQLNATAISARWVKEQMEESRSQRIVLLLDCCYGGAFAKGRTPMNAGVKGIVKQLDGRGRVVITASGKRELAYESIFTNAVVQGLSTGEADLDGDGLVSVDELYDYVYEQVRHCKPKQTPTKSANEINGKLYLATIPPFPLPDEVEQALSSEIAWMRVGAVSGLRPLLAGDHPRGLQRTARLALHRVHDDDIDPDVRAAARKALRSVSPQSNAIGRRFIGHRRQRVLRLTGGVLALGAVLGIGLPIITERGGGQHEVTPPAVGEDQPPLACSPNVQPADGVLSLGTLLPKTGAFHYSGPALGAGVQLAMKDINDAGGIPSVAVTLDAANQHDEGDSNDPSAAAAHQSIDALLASKVDVIIGPATSQVALKVIDKVVCAGTIMFAPSNTSSVFTTYPDHGLYFRTAALSALEGAVLGKLVVDDGKSKVVLMSRGDAFGDSLREETKIAIEKSEGQVVDSFHYDPNARDYSREIQRVKDKSPHAVVLIGFNESAQILAKMIEEGLGPASTRLYVSGANMTNTLVSQVSPRNPGALASIKGAPLDTGGEEFVRRLREANPGLRDLIYAAQAYDAVVITALAAAAAGTDAPAAVATEINGVTKVGDKCTSFAACMTLVKDGRNIDYDGLSGPLEFTDPGEPCSATYVISEIQADGTVKSLRSERVGC
ncbi:MAG: caspase, EACC1-associated type [Pseudonocardiaceae bacterium]